MADPTLTQIDDRELENMTVDTAAFPYQKMRGQLYWNGSAWVKWDGTTSSSQGTAAANSGKWPVKVINSDDTDNSYTTGGVAGQKVHVVGISDIYAEGTIAVGSSLTGHKPLAGGFKDASGNNQFVTGDTTNGVDVDVTRLPALVAGTANIGKVIQSNVLVPADHDYIGLAYTGSNLTTVTFKTGGSGGTVVATLTLAYTGSRLDSVTKT